MKELILAKYGEIALKGLNKSYFESVLTRNVRKALEPIGQFDIKIMQSTMYVELADENDPFLEDLQLKAKQRIRDVFGFSSITVAAQAQKDIDDLARVTLEYLELKFNSIKTFKVEAKRSDKLFPIKSPEICREIGGRILSRYHHLKVDVHNPEMVVTVEIRDKHAYVHCESEQGSGGIPVGTSGKATLLLSGGIDSPVAGYMMARRGLELTCVYFSTPPYTSERATNKVLSLAQLISRYTGFMKVYVVPFTQIQEEIAKVCPSDLFTLVMRRFMMRAAEKITHWQGGGALVTGESLGQVASQTIGGLNVTAHAVDMPIFQPLIGMDKIEITDISRKIGTFETSILPYEDCCAMFSPKHPRINPKVADVERGESSLDVQTLLEQALVQVTEYTVEYQGEIKQVVRKRR